MTSETASEEMIARWVQPNPHKEGPAEAWLPASGVSVWVLINQLHLDGWKVERVAKDYQLPLEAVKAAVAYYERHKEIIDARIALGRSAADVRPADNARATKAVKRPPASRAVKDGFRELSREEGWQLLEKQARLYLGMSAREFVEKWDAGRFENPDRPEVLRVAMLLPFVRE
jgi:uncharacterized protein (DUF433 family)